VIATAFVDTGAWIALIVRNDPNHRAARTYWRDALRRGGGLVTSTYVMAETATWLRYRVGLPAVQAYRQRLDRAAAAGTVSVHRVDEAEDRAGWDLMDRYADLALSFTDATSAAVAGRMGIGEIFGFDADFRALGFLVRPEG
jgi:predicted nucleic acid-binding protein